MNSLVQGTCVDLEDLIFKVTAGLAAHVLDDKRADQDRLHKLKESISQTQAIDPARPSLDDALQQCGRRMAELGSAKKAADLKTMLDGVNDMATVTEASLTALSTELSKHASPAGATDEMIATTFDKARTLADHVYGKLNEYTATEGAFEHHDLMTQVNDVALKLVNTFRATNLRLQT